MSKYTEAIEQYKHWYKRGFNHSDMPSSGILVTMGEALEIADRLEQADAQAHYLDRMRQTTKKAGYADGYIQAVKDIRGDDE